MLTTKKKDLFKLFESTHSERNKKSSSTNGIFSKTQKAVVANTMNIKAKEVFIYLLTTMRTNVF